jgi:hypothetical protein
MVFDRKQETGIYSRTVRITAHREACRRAQIRWNMFDILMDDVQNVPEPREIACIAI